MQYPEISFFLTFIFKQRNSNSSFTPTRELPVPGVEDVGRKCGEILSWGLTREKAELELLRASPASPGSPGSPAS